MLNTSSALLSIYQETLFVNNLSPKKEPILGDFNKKICIYISKSSNTEANIILLLNLLKACKLTVQDCFVFEIENAVVETTPIFKQYKPEIILSFGVQLTNELFNLYIKKNDVVTFADAKILYTASLETLQNTPAEKSALWSTLQFLFKL